MLLEPEAYARIYTGSSQGVVARLFESGFVEASVLFDGVMDAPLPLILALDQVQDPGNAGTLARTLYALGGAGMLVPRHNGVYLGAAAAKAAAGALEKLPVAKVTNLANTLAEAQKIGFTIYGTASAPLTADAPQTEDIFTLSPRLPAILVLGSEESGMRPNVLKHCNTLLSIPMVRKSDSLNVAQAGAIALAWIMHAWVKK